jgi:hypothetical protein
MGRHLVVMARVGPEPAHRRDPTGQIGVGGDHEAARADRFGQTAAVRADDRQAAALRLGRDAAPGLAPQAGRKQEPRAGVDLPHVVLAPMKVMLRMGRDARLQARRASGDKRPAFDEEERDVGALPPRFRWPGRGPFRARD